VLNLQYSSVLHYVKIYLHKILRNSLLSTVGRFIYTKYRGILYVEHCEKICLHKILRNTFINIKYSSVFCVNKSSHSVQHKCFPVFCVNKSSHSAQTNVIPLGNTLCWALWEDLFTQNTGKYFMLNTVGRFNYTKYWEILSVKHCGKIYLHKILRNTFWWNSVGRFIYTNYWCST
jgi:hypothetical protein